MILFAVVYISSATYDINNIYIGNQMYEIYFFWVDIFHFLPSSPAPLRLTVICSAVCLYQNCETHRPGPGLHFTVHNYCEHIHYTVHLTRL